MKKAISRNIAIALFLSVILVSSCTNGDEKKKNITPTDTAPVSSEEVSSEPEHGHRFEPDDCKVNGVGLGMTADEVREIMGKPKFEGKYAANQIHGAFISMDYPGVNFCFNQEDDGEYRLSECYITGEEIELANGLHVGNTLNEAVIAFDNPESVSFSEDSPSVSYMQFVYNSTEFYPHTFDPNWPDEPVQAAYYYDYKTDSSPLVYIYCEPPVWNDDRTGYTIKEYVLAFRVTPGEDRIIEIDVQLLNEYCSERE